MAYKINKSQWAQLKTASGERLNNLNSKANTNYTMNNNNNTNQVGSVAL